MKKTWQAPRILVQEFETNEYVAACYSLYCKISGDGKGGVICGDAGITDEYPVTRTWGGFTYTSDGKPHGKPCALGTSYDEGSGNFYESGKLSSASNIQINNDEVLPDGSQYAIWTSHDVNGTGDYNHYGYAVPVDNRPNHS